MASKVIRIKNIHSVQQECVGGTVVLKLTARMDGKQVRAEIALEACIVEEVARRMTEGTERQVSKWTAARDTLK